MRTRVMCRVLWAGLSMIAGFAIVVSAQPPGSYAPSVYAGGGTDTTSTVVAPTSAQLAGPFAVAFDSSRNLLTVEPAGPGPADSPRIRRLRSDGLLQTLTTGTYIAPPSFAGQTGCSLSTAACRAPWSVVALPNGTPVVAIDPRLTEIPGTHSYGVFQLGSSASLVSMAGTGTKGFSGDNGPATSAQFAEISALAVDAAGNVYVADDGNFRVRKISTNGIVTTIAGTGVQGSQGDGGAATAAQISSVGGLAVLNGNVYLTQPSLSTIRRIGTNGVIQTIAGNGNPGAPQEGAVATSTSLQGPIMIATTPDGRIIFVDAGSGSLDLFLRTVDTSGNVWTVYSTAWAAGSSGAYLNCLGATGQIASGSLAWINSLATDSAGNAALGTESTGGGGTGLPSSGPIAYHLAPTPILLNGNAVVSAASYGNILAPGALFVIFGTGFGPTQLTDSSFGADGLLPTQLSGTQVLFDGIPAPLVYTSNSQVAGFVPFAVGYKNVCSTCSVVCSVINVKSGNAVSGSVTQGLGSLGPAIFTANASGVGQAAALNTDGSFNSAANPVSRGQVIVFYATGAGITNPASVDGSQAIPPNLPVPVLPVSVKIGGQAAQVQYAGAAPYLAAGTIQVNAVVPSSALTGSSVTLELLINGQSSALFLNAGLTDQVTIAVQ
jgi:uncharacterized protein (TIGR03437 family)